MITLATIAYVALAALSGLVIPLVIAVVVGTLATPLVDLLERWRVKRGIGASVVIVGLLLLIGGSIVVAVNGVVDQSAELSKWLTAGLASIESWAEELDINVGLASGGVDSAADFGRTLLPGLSSYASTVFSSLVSFLAGTFIAVFLLYFILAD